MSRLIGILTLIGLLACNPTDSPQKSEVITQGNFQKYKNLDTTHTIEIERHVVDLDFDSKADTLILENLQDLVGDPQLYSIIRVVLSNQEEYLLKNVAGYKIDPQSEVSLKNRIKSENIFLPNLGKAKTVLCLWDYPYPDCSNKFEILAWEREGFKTLFREDVEVDKLTWQKENSQFLLDISRDCGNEKDKALIELK